ncbi:MAG TPA: FMN-binding protein [Bacillota bacterium]|nr:FMN-binding protein [Bacillota bacterium]
MKKFLIIAGVVVVVLGCAVGGLIWRLSQMADKIEIAQQQLTSVDLNQIADGEYRGSFGDFAVSVTLKTTVKDHRITDIKIVDQSCGKGYDARDTVMRIIKAQSPQVDAVTGATSSSRSIMVAVHRSLLRTATEK